MMSSAGRPEMARQPGFTGGGSCGGGERVWEAWVSEGAAAGDLRSVL
jgi:hypothetical protein